MHRMGAFWLVMVLVLCGSTALALGLHVEPVELVATAWVEGEPMNDAMRLSVDPTMNDTWLWMTYHASYPLTTVELTVEPSGRGTLFFPELQDPYSAFDLDVTASETTPIRFELHHEDAVILSGWLTISPNPAPYDLPMQPGIAQEVIWEDPAIVVEPEPEIVIEPEEIEKIETVLPLKNAVVITPHTGPAYIPDPVPTSGYAMVMYDNVNIRNAPNGNATIVGRTTANEVIYVNGLSTDNTGTPWYNATFQPMNAQGYCKAAYVRFMSQDEITRYLNSLKPTPRPTPIPTPRPRPTPYVTPQPIQQSGYAYVIADSLNLRLDPNGIILAKLTYYDVVYVNSQQYDFNGQGWHNVSVAKSGMTGYVVADYVRLMTPQEVSQYLNSLNPTPRPTPLPTIRPTPVPTKAPTAVNQTGYAYALADNLNIRTTPNGTVVGRAAYMDVLYINGLVYDTDGNAWYHATLQRSNISGLVRAEYTRFMTPAEVSRYLISLQPTPVPTPRPTPTPIPQTGYAYVIYDNVNLRSAPGGTVTGRATVWDVLYINGQQVDATGVQWHRITQQKTGLSGYIQSGYTRFMTAVEIAQYLDSIRPTPSPSPTPRPTLNPNAQYVVTHTNGVNFRVEPNGKVIKQLAKNVTGRIAGPSVLANGSWWYYVEINGMFGYIHETVVNPVIGQTTGLVTPKPTTIAPTVKPTVAPTMIPLPTATIWPTFPPQTAITKARISLETAQIEDALIRSGVRYAAMATRDFDADGHIELLLAQLNNGTLSLTAYGLNANNSLSYRVSRSVTAVLPANAKLQVVLLQQAGRELVYIAQQDKLSGRTTFAHSWTLVGNQWADWSLSADRGTPLRWFEAETDAAGNVIITNPVTK